MQTIRTRAGQTLAFSAYGTPRNPPLLLLHGFCEDSSVWATLIPLLEEQYVLVADLPGFGASERSADATLEAWADAIAELLETLSLPPVVCCGHSLGGYVGLALAERHPHLLAGLSLFHSHPYPDSPERIEGRRRAIELLQQGKKDLYVAQLFPNLFAPAFASAYPDIVEGLIANGRQQSAEGIIDALKAMMQRPDRHAVLENLQIPLQMLLGKQDNLIPLEDGLRSALKAARVEVKVWPEAGHMGMYENTTQSAAALANFVTDCILFQAQ